MVKETEDKVVREKVGKIASELMQKKPESRDPIELQREMDKEYLPSLIECVGEEKKKFSKNFFIIVLTKREKLMPNVYRNYFFGRNTCPTPDFDQSVFFYNRKEDRLEYIWTIPDREACHYLINNASHVIKSERGLLNFVLAFADHSLYKLCRKLNNEPLLIDGMNG